MSDAFGPHAANQNRDPCATLAGAHFHLLRARAHLLRQNPMVMTAAQFRKWREALDKVQEALREVELRLCSQNVSGFASSPAGRAGGGEFNEVCCTPPEPIA